jgi:2'-5' RNA ligase
VSAGERVRLFVALELPEEVRSSLIEWRAAAISELDGVRGIPPQSLHVTLCFLGWREATEIEPIARACEMACSEHAELALELGAAVWLPRRHPRVLAVQVEDPIGRLAWLQDSLSERLSAGGYYQRENRPFLGHVTVGRLGRGARMGRRELHRTPVAEFVARAVTLFRSRLGAAGARYEPLRKVELA